jgi:hypothetical protein
MARWRNTPSQMMDSSGVLEHGGHVRLLWKENDSIHYVGLFEVTFLFGFLARF